MQNKFLLELAACYMANEGKTVTCIKGVNGAFGALCEYSLDRNVHSLNDVVNSQTIPKFLDFIKRSYPNSWNMSYVALRTCLKVHFPDVVWPQLQKFTTTPTEGHSPYAFGCMMVALRQEIDRIRAKSGRFERAVEAGRILTFEDLEPCINTSKPGKLTAQQLEQLADDLKQLGQSLENRRVLAAKYGISLPLLNEYIKIWEAGGKIKTKSQILSLTKEDLIATVHYYIPHWPVATVVARLNSREIYKVYKEIRGILLAKFDSREDAEKFADANGGIVITNDSFSISANINPGEYLLAGFQNSALCKKMKSIVSSVPELIEEYFLTYYDLTCVILYFACLTGWNLETMRSVSVHSLGLIFNTNNPMDLFSTSHIIIKGYKRRGQADDKEKEYNHISDKNDRYGLYCVLSDIYKLTKPFRRFLNGDEQNCILVAMKRDHSLCMFGPSSNCVNEPLNSGGSGNIKLFFMRNEIFEDEKSKNRIEVTNAMKIRTTYESMLEHMGMSAEIRRFFMGHMTVDTTMTSYGSDMVSRGIRRKLLRENLDQLAAKAFRGELFRYEQVKKGQSNDKIIQLFIHIENTVFVCKDRTRPTWPGHETYIVSNICDFFEKCLFCEQCYVTEDSLPVLLRWRRDIREYLSEAENDISLDILIYLQAIEEVLELCSIRGNLWTEALIDAEISEIDPAFTAPPFWSGG
ncbi:hypothetical protein [Pelosinus sp. sgz500959]|uniref:hypothetical protein n=1 Tax=Pelosinus sp. sgz500959 TaxID=3242472 RepID=UPI00366D53CB